MTTFSLLEAHTSESPVKRQHCHLVLFTTSWKSRTDLQNRVGSTRLGGGGRAVTHMIARPRPLLSQEKREKAETDGVLRQAHCRRCLLGGHTLDILSSIYVSSLHRPLLYASSLLYLDQAQPQQEASNKLANGHTHKKGFQIGTTLQRFCRFQGYTHIDPFLKQNHIGHQYDMCVPHANCFKLFSFHSLVFVFGGAFPPSCCAFPLEHPYHFVASIHQHPFPVPAEV